jgi:hypothetical protein
LSRRLDETQKSVQHDQQPQCTQQSAQIGNHQKRTHLQLLLVPSRRECIPEAKRPKELEAVSQNPM